MLKFKAKPPVSMSAAHRMSALDGCDESANVVASIGPMTMEALMTDVSKAYAVRKTSAGTMDFQIGRTERLIGGAVNPRMKASTKIDLEV